jgi:hypothetical protein
MQIPWHAFLPLPQPKLEAWNSDLLNSYPAWRAFAGVALLAVAALILWPRKLALALFALGSAGLLAFGYVKFIGAMRHHGHLWLLFVMAIWLAGGIGARDDRRSLREYLLLALLVTHCLATAYLSYLDLRYPFSNGAGAAALIREKNFERMPLLGYREPPAATVALSLGMPLYAPSRDLYATHTDWGPLQRDLSLPELRCAARKLAQREQADVLLVMNRQLTDWPELARSGSLTGAMVESENYFLYKLDRSALARTSADAACAARTIRPSTSTRS